MEKLKEVSKLERNYGIDVLRILAMFFVVILHSLGHGGVLNNVIVGSLQYKFVWFMEIFAYCAVDIFSLISGYVSYREDERRTSYSNYIGLWFQVLFYGVIINFLFCIVDPSLVAKSDCLMAFFPVINGMYWYFIAYTGLFIMIPFLNYGIRYCSKDTLKKLFVVIFLIFSLFDTIFKRFCLSGGYSFVWLVLLYLLGAIIKKCEIGKKLRGYQIVLGIFVLYMITYFYKIYGFEGFILKVSITKDLLISYTSPMVLWTAILYVIGFSKIRCSSSLLKKVIHFGASSTFSIYLINEHKLVRSYMIEGLFVGLYNQSFIKILVDVVSFSFLFVIGAIFIDKIRIFLFKIWRVPNLICKIDKGLNVLVEKLSNLL